MEHLIEVFENSILLYLIFLKISLSQNQVAFKIGFPITLAAYTIIFITFKEPLYLTFFLEIIIYFFLPCILLKAIPKKVIIQTALIIVGITTLVGSIAVAFSNAFLPNNVISEISFILFNSIVVLVFIVAIHNKRIYTYLFNLFSLSKNSQTIIVVFIWEMVFLVSIQAVFLSMDLGIRLSIFTGMVLILILFGSCIIVHLLITNDIKKSYYKQINKNLEQAMYAEIKHYEQLNLSYESIRKFRHDFNNIIIGLRSLLNQNDITASLKYLDQCTKHLNDSAPSIQTGHPIVNALLADKVQISKEKHININFNGYIAYDTMDPIDLCIVFGNVIDNAIEACRKLSNEQQKEICISAHIVKDMFFITCTNPSSEIMVDANNILTTKDDSINHGIGLHNIRSIVHKYDGHMQLSYADQIFTIELAFILST